MATKEEGFFSRQKSEFIKQFHHYIFFRKAVFFISGLIFGHSLVKHAVLATIILYITENWDEPNLLLAVIILNAQEGLSSVLVVFEAHLADSYLGRFYVIIFSTISMIGGLTLLRLLNPAENLALFGGVAVLIALGEAGKEPSLKAFLAEQLKENDTTSSDQSKDENTATDQLKKTNPVPDELKNEETTVPDQSKGENIAAEESKNDEASDAESPEEKRLDDRVKVWWRLFRLLGALLGTFGLPQIPWKDAWRDTFLTTAIVMAATLLIFLSGFRFYRYEEPRGSPILTVFRVFRSAISNRGIQYSDKSSDYFKNDGGKVPISPDVPLSRWVDKAALVVKKSPTSAKKEQANNKVVEPCTATQVKEVKKLLRMVPMWGTFIVYCVTQATGSTFFFEQTTDLDDTIGGYKVPLVSFYLMQTFSSLAIMFVSSKVISSKWFKDDEKKKLMAYKVRIGLGMACSCLACVAAMLVERERLQRVKKHLGSDNRKKDMQMSVFYLTPQFCLLGLMEGLTEDGLVDFFYYQVAESAKNYGPSFNEFAMGLGKFFNIFWVLAFKGWFGKTINKSRLDKYYMVLALVSFGNLFVVYTFVSIFVYKDVKGVKRSLDDSLEADFRGGKNAQDGPRYNQGGDSKDGGHEEPPCCCFSLFNV